MKTGFIFFLLFITVQSNFAQSPISFENKFTEKTTPQEKFEIYLDSLDKYLYRDTRISEYTMTKCEEIINQKITLPDSSRFEYVLQTIFYSHNMADPFGAYKIINENKSSLNNWNISVKQKGTFNYLKAYTFMEIGDLEAAQKAYYSNLDTARVYNDTSTIIGSTYSLGQLFNLEGDYETSIKHFTEILNLSNFITIRPSTLTLVHMELSNSLKGNNQYDLALENLSIAYDLASKNNLKVLKSEILIQKGNNFLDNGDIKNAKITYTQILKDNKGGLDQNVKKDTELFLAKIYQAEKKYPLAMETFENLLGQADTSNYDQVLNIYDNMHKVSYEMNDHNSAYNNLLSFNHFKKKRDEDVKKQKTEYLKIKFEAGEKEKENALLGVQVLESQAKSNLLFVFLGFAGLILTLLFGAFYQKVRYSKNLELEVSKRTISLSQSNTLLNQSNKELKEFNRILSHDLKEPIRSIVGFSQLASRPNTKKENLNEYLSYVISGGQQLQYLIGSISTYQQVDGINFCEFESVDFQKSLNNSIKEVQKNFTTRTIDLNLNSTIALYTVKDPFESILKIILSNAAKFNKNQLVKIEVNYLKKDDQHLIEFKDNGIGIEEEYHGKVFEMFQRLNNREDYNGAGLGLSIAHKLVERLHGSLSITSSSKEDGSVFLLSLPVESPSKIDHSKYLKENLSTTIS